MEIVLGILSIVAATLVTIFVARWQLGRSERLERARQQEEEAKRRREEAKKEKKIVVDFLVFLESRRLLREGADYEVYSSVEEMYDAVAEIYRRLTEFRAQLWSIVFPESPEIEDRRLPYGISTAHDVSRKNKVVWEEVSGMQARCKDLLMYVESWLFANDEKWTLFTIGSREHYELYGSDAFEWLRGDYGQIQHDQETLETFQAASIETRRALCEAFDLCHAPFCERFC